MLSTFRSKSIPRSINLANTLFLVSFFLKFYIYKNKWSLNRRKCLKLNLLFWKLLIINFKKIPVILIWQSVTAKQTFRKILDGKLLLSMKWIVGIKLTWICICNEQVCANLFQLLQTFTDVSWRNWTIQNWF